MKLEKLNTHHIEHWQNVIEKMDQSPCLLGAPEYYASANDAQDNVYVWQSDNLFLPLIKHSATHLGILKSDLFSGVRYNSLLGTYSLTDKVFDELDQLPSANYRIQIPLEKYQRNKERFRSIYFFKQDSTIFYFIDLPDNYDDWFMRKKVCRKEIRQAFKTGVECKIGGIELLDDFYTTYMGSYKRWQEKGLINKNPGYDRFKRAFEYPGEHTKIAISYYDNKAIGGLVFAYYKDTAGALFAGQDYEHQRKRPTNLAYAEAIRYLIERNVKILNIGSNLKREGLAHFKTTLGTNIKESVILSRHKFKRLKSLFTK